MENTALLHLLESILGKGYKTSKGNYAFKCPHNCHPTKHKLEINLETEQYHCWICNDFKGKTIKSLFKKLKINDGKSNELKYVLHSSEQNQRLSSPLTHEKIELPKEFISLSEEPENLGKLTILEYKRAISYLKKRNIFENDIIKYNIGFCSTGKYQNKVIIPSYDENGQLNYFIARDYSNTSYRKYDNPIVPLKEIIGFDLYINWDAPIILTEGIFDAMAIKRNAIPLFGKSIPENGALMKKLIMSSVKKIYLCLDKDAIKDAISISERLINLGKEVYLVELNGKDPSEIGFVEIFNIIENVVPLTFQSLLDLKLNAI